MLRFQLWKIFLVFSVLSLGVIYSLPNIFPPDPAVQITFNSSGGSFNDRVVENIKSNAEKKNINFLIRGIRNEIDFTYEKDIANSNRELDNNVETVFFISSPTYSHISSKIVREIIKNNGDISKFVSYTM